MSEPENFISRWSRRKAEATEQDAAPAATPDAQKDANVEHDASAGAAAAQPSAPPPEIDPATLPPIESIGAGTDISAFLKTGVPADLTRAALRRAWAADPNIRDFIGLSENSWDFTANDGVPGFGPLSAEDAGRAMAEFTGKAKEAIERISQFEPPGEPLQAKLPASESSPQPVRLESASKKTVSPEQDQPEQNPAANADTANSLQCEKENIATQQNIP